MLGPVVRIAAVLAATAIPVIGTSGASPAPESRAGDALGGAAGTVIVEGRMAYSMPVSVLRPDQRADFAAGRRLFRIVWREKAFSEETVGMAGLGPLFNQRSCAGCHVRNGRGQPPEENAFAPANGMIWRVLYPGVDDATPRHHFGSQIQDQAVPGADHEDRIAVRYQEQPGQFADGTPFSLRVPTYVSLSIARPNLAYLSPRIPPAVFGGGLIEAVDGAALAALADPFDDDDDGISGRLSWVRKGDTSHFGRFGWKARQASLRDQVVEAAAEDLGLASPDRPQGGCSRIQSETIPTCAQDTEIGADAIEQIVSYLRGLAVPARRNIDDPAVLRGAHLFTEAGCTGCHRPSLPTGDYAPLPALGGQIIHPYTDLLLHDMGPDLADPAPDGKTDRGEWRTPPLWGIGLAVAVNGHGFFLHDGRARSLMEAVLWHGGEGAAARDAVLSMPRRDRAALIAFLNSL